MTIPIIFGRTPCKPNCWPNLLTREHEYGLWRCSRCGAYVVRHWRLPDAPSL